MMAHLRHKPIKIIGPAAVIAACVFGAPAADSGANLSFLRGPSTNVGNACCSVVTADFNGDGQADIAATHGTNALTILLGDGKGNFTRSDLALDLGPGVVLKGLVASADFNADHIADLVAITQDGAYNYGSLVLLGLGNGSFRAPLLLGPGVVKAVADFNRDGKPDLLIHPCAGDIDCGFSVRLGNGDGTFKPAGPVTAQPSGDFTWAAVADFNGDGKPDVVETTFRSPPSGSVYLWLGNGDGTFGSPIVTALTGGVLSSQLVTGDFNRDGHTDLAVLVEPEAEADAYGIEILLGTGTGAFSLGSIYPVPRAAQLIAADFEHTGRLDLAAGFTILPGNGDGTFRAGQAFGQYTAQMSYPDVTYPDLLGPPGGISWVAVGDFDNDGKADLAGSAGQGTQVAILINNTPGSDASANAVSAANYSSAVAPGSMASLFGSGLATGTAQATGPPWPVSLANTNVRVLDAKGVERPAELLYVSPTQVNFVIPPATAPGFAIFNVTGSHALPDGSRSTLVVPLAPAVFTLNGTGQGPPAATAVRVEVDGSQTPVPVAQCSSASACILIPIDLRGQGSVYLSLYGTGFRQAGNASCDLSPPSPTPPRPAVTYAGPQPMIPGLDQLNVRLPGNLPAGIVTIACYFTPLIPPFTDRSASFSIAIQ